MVLLLYKINHRYTNNFKNSNTLDVGLNEEWKKSGDEETIVNELIVIYLVDFANIPVKDLSVIFCIFIIITIIINIINNNSIIIIWI